MSGKDATNSRSRSPRNELAGSANEATVEDQFQTMYETVVAPQLETHRRAHEETVKNGVKTLVLGELQAMEARVDTKLAVVQSDVTEVKGILSRIEDLLAANP